MNDPIISPWLIYFINQWDIWQGTIFFLGILSIVAMIAFPLILAISDDSSFEEGTPEKVKSLWKKSLILIIPFFTLFLTTPDKSTLIQMLCANQTTKANIEKVVEITGDINEVVKKEVKGIKDELKQDVIDIIKETKKESKFE